MSWLLAEHLFFSLLANQKQLCAEPHAYSYLKLPPKATCPIPSTHSQGKEAPTPFVLTRKTQPITGQRSFHRCLQQTHEYAWVPQRKQQWGRKEAWVDPAKRNLRVGVIWIFKQNIQTIWRQECNVQESQS